MSNKLYKSDHASEILLKLDIDRNGEKKFCDVTLNAESHDFALHKCILVMFSVFFKTMFTTEMKEKYDNKGTVHGVSKKVMETILNFMYTGSLILNHQNIFEIVAAAHYLEISYLKDFCIQFLLEHMDINNCLSVRAFAKKYDYIQVVDGANKLLAENCDALILTEEFKRLEIEEATAIFKHKEIKISTEEAFYHSVIGWIKHDVSTREKHIEELFGLIKLEKLTWSFLINTVQEEPLVMNCLECAKRFIHATTAMGRSQSAMFEQKQDGFLVLKKNKAFRYEVKSKFPTNIPDMKYDHYGGSSVKFNDEVYVISGLNTNAVERLDLKNPFQWTQLTSPYGKRKYAASAACGEYIYTVGGGGWNRAMSSGERYDRQNDKWYLVKDMNYERSGPALVYNGGLLYALGGRKLNRAESYDPREGFWRELPQMKVMREDLVAVVLREQIYAIGGHDPRHDILSSVEMYDPRNRSWCQEAALNIARRFHGACVVNEKIFVAGGSSKTLEIFDPKTGAWELEEGPIDLEDLDSIVPL